jgi:hypothetical protein
MLALLVLWAIVVALTVFVMARRGHSWFYWTILTGVLGPLAWPIAVRAVLAERDDTADLPRGDVRITGPPWTRAPEDVLEAVRRAAPIDGSATLVRVLDAEEADTPAGRADAEASTAFLDRCCTALRASGLVAGPVECRLLYGRAPDELARIVRVGGYRRIVLGESGPAWHHVLHGHTRARLGRLVPTAVDQLRDERTTA